MFFFNSEQSIFFCLHLRISFKASGENVKLIWEFIWGSFPPETPQSTEFMFRIHLKIQQQPKQIFEKMDSCHKLDIKLITAVICKEYLYNLYIYSCENIYYKLLQGVFWICEVFFCIWVLLILVSTFFCLSAQA